MKNGVHTYFNLSSITVNSFLTDMVGLPEHKTASLVQCVEEIANVLLPDISVITDATPVSCRSGRLLSPKYA